MKISTFALQRWVNGCVGWRGKNKKGFYREKLELGAFHDG